MAGAAKVAAPAAPIPVTLRKSLLFIESIPVGGACRGLLGEAFIASMEQSVPDFHPELIRANEKARPSREGRAAFYDLRLNQPRVRERIMKLS
jgi:hypothetical protein